MRACSMPKLAMPLPRKQACIGPLLSRAGATAPALQASPRTRACNMPCSWGASASAASSPGRRKGGAASVGAGLGGRGGMAIIVVATGAARIEATETAAAGADAETAETMRGASVTTVWLAVVVDMTGAAAIPCTTGRAEETAGAATETTGMACPLSVTGGVDMTLSITIGEDMPPTDIRRPYWIGATWHEPGNVCDTIGAAACANCCTTPGAARTLMLLWDKT
mmetsp:Transcript_23213/g.75061  ORF Transcript_23213/g.75061 Transcript_23213/m.75061 type:complete len:224 (-) Transcript_23213:253-924(-)